jgi:hypothetical protein
MSNVVAIVVRLESGARLTFTGRDAWALAALIDAGERGCTPLDHVGPRWSGYVHKLRKAGVVVETIRERHGGPFAGQHARYVLCSALTVVDRVHLGEERGAA